MATIFQNEFGGEVCGTIEDSPAPLHLLKHKFPSAVHAGEFDDPQGFRTWGGTVDLIMSAASCKAISAAGKMKYESDPRSQGIHRQAELAAKLVQEFKIGLVGHKLIDK